MSDQPTHPFSISASTQEGKLAAVERKIVACAMLTTGFGTLSALRVTENGKTSYQIAATCRFDVAYEAYGNDEHNGVFARMSVRGNVLIMDLLGIEAAKEDPSAVCMLDETYSSFESMWANYEMIVSYYMNINKIWLKAREAEKKTKEKGA